MGSHMPEEVLRVPRRMQEEFLDAVLQRYPVGVQGVDAAAQKELAGRYLQAD